MERACGKEAAGGLSKAADCGEGQARQLLASKAAAGGPGEAAAGGVGGPTFECR